MARTGSCARRGIAHPERIPDVLRLPLTAFDGDTDDTNPNPNPNPGDQTTAGWVDARVEIVPVVTAPGVSGLASEVAEKIELCPRWGLRRTTLSTQ